MAADVDQGVYEAGMAAYHAGDYRQAIVRLEAVADGTSMRAALARFYAGQAHLRLGQDLYEEGRYATAAEHFRRAAALNPSAGGLCRHLALCYMALRRHEAAASEMAKGVEADPDDVESRVRLALLNWKKGDASAAEAVLREGLARRSDEPEWLYQLGTLLACEDRIDEAIEVLRRCLAHAPDHGRAHARLAQCYGVGGRVDLAARHLELAQGLEPNDAMIAFQLAMISGRISRSVGGRATLRRPPAVDTDDRRAMDRLAAMVEEDPEFVEAFVSLPPTEVDAEVFAALLAVLERAIERHPRYADLHHRCSQVLQRLGRLEEAVRRSEQALEINPRYVAAMIQLAQLYAATDRQVQAIVRLEQAIQTGANYPDVHYMLGRLYHARGLKDEARWAYETALRLNGGYDAARKALTELAA